MRRWGVGTREEILRQIQKKARSYTPEWRFDMENPDIGTALALVYARMLEGTLRRFAEIPKKNRIAFLNELDAKLLPAMPSTGYIVFKMVNEETEGVELEAGTTVSADVPDSPEGQVEFETTDDLYVTPAVLLRIYQTCGQKDQIFRIYRNDAEEGAGWPVVLFSNRYPNLQEHMLYLSHSVLFGIRTEGRIRMEWQIPGDARQSGEFLEALQNEEAAVFEYYSEDGWKRFCRQELSEGALLFQKGEGQPAFRQTEFAGIQSFWIRCRIRRQDAFDGMRLGSIKLTGSNQGILPDTVYGAGEERNIHEYLPFGERLDLYSEVYFGCQEVLGKSGAQITLSFGIDFVRIPLNGEKIQIEWEWVMKKSDFRPNTEFDVTIEAVIWEYYNGSGWARLFPKDSYQQIFSVRNGTMGQYQTMEFTCPEDMAPVLINAAEAFYIRARITKINNLYKTTGNYVVPLLSNTLFRYQYREGRLPEQIVLENNMDRRCISGRELFAGEEVLPFTKAGVDGMAVYLGFGTAPIGNPLKMLFLLGFNEDRSQRHLLWEYWNGSHWKNLNLVDETENFSRTGIVTFSGQPDIRKRRMFGEEKYWLRIRDISDAYLDAEEEILPVIRAIYMNAAAIQNVAGRRTDYFQVEMYQENMRFDLPEKNINKIDVLVAEEERMPESERMELMRQERLVTVPKEDGQWEEWVRWQRVDDFTESTPQDRHFIVNQTEGYLQFGNGRQGRIPAASRMENIRVEYQTGGGEYTNLKEGLINKMDRQAGFIREVSNPEALTGGCDVETLQQAVRRNSAALRHQNRAVVPRDYEELAMLASREIQSVKCFAGYDAKGEPLRGAVTLVVLQKAFRQSGAEFHKVKRQILDYMRDKISQTLLDNKKFFVVEPVFAELCVYAELSVRDFNKVFAVKKEVLRRLEKFLSPAGEKNGGWQIGSFPDNMQIQNAINDVPGIVYIKSIMLTAYTSSTTGRREVDVEQIKNSRYVLPVNGTHELVITINTR